MVKKIPIKRGNAPRFHLDLSYDDVASLCHLITTQNAYADRLADQGKPTLKEVCDNTKPLWEALISYLDIYS